ncbi:mRNA-capping enzyme subunit alpha [Skeletonema marinoi]|uniref:mRNA-capping enzyme subunit alpha n=1 Tax=Skeletonema marinoi TaxID=267567 RepID=A0AAD8Y4F7_9STRA|nr:mRNA-capping enzyme subunit alpha [Skeletonema marinoi]
MNRPPLLPWSKETFASRWSTQGRLSSTPIPRTPFLLLKAPVSTLYEEKFGGDRNMFTVGMYCTRMMARSIRIGLVVDCTALDLEEFEPLPATKQSNNAASSRTSAAAARRNGNSNNNSAAKDPRVRYFHNPSEWDDFDVEYHRMMPPPVDGNSSNSTSTGNDEPVAPKILNDFFRVISNFQKSVNSSSNDTTTTHIALFDSRGGLGAAAYLAAAYMCHTLKAPVHAAIQAVKEGTPPQPSPDNDPSVKWGLCDVRLVKDLQSRFMGRKEIVMEGKVPTWWWALDEEEDGEEEEEDDGDGESTSNDGKKKRKRESIIIPPHESATTAANGTKRPRIDNESGGNSSNTLHPRLPTEALEPIPIGSPKYIRAVTVLTQLAQATPQPTDSIPSVLPLKPELDVSNNSADNATIQSIKSNPNEYKVTWLSKGRRGLLLILSEAVFFVEQQSSSMQVSQVTSMKFPTPQDSKKSQHRTLLDVVLVTDVEKGSPTHRFYALDILCIEGGRVWHKPWEQRWKFLNEGVVLPRKKEEAKQQQQPQQQHGHIYSKEPIKLRAKEYFPMRKLAFVMKDVCAGVAHDANGIRVVPMGEYSAMAVVWQKGGDVGDEKLVSLLG